MAWNTAFIESALNTKTKRNRDLITMKELSARRLWIFFIAPLLLLLQGFTFDYEVLSECERRHPNDLITRLVCNSRVEDEFRELRSLDCVNRQREKLISTHKEPLHALLVDSGNEKSVAIYNKLSERGYKPKFISTEQRKKVIVFEKPIACDTEAKLSFNLVFDQDDRIEYLAAWITYPKRFSYGGWIRELQWERAQNSLLIELAARRRQLAEEKQRAEAKARLDAANVTNSALGAELSDKGNGAVTENDNIFRGAIWILAFLLIAFVLYLLLAPLSPVRDWISRLVKLRDSAHRTVNQDDLNRDGSVPQQQGYEDESGGKRPYTTTELEIMAKFRSTHVFVQIDVPVQAMNEFLKESLWYKQKTGVFPGIPEQRQILSEIDSAKQAI